MAKQSKLISETTMYAVNKDTGDIVVHHLPWPRTSPQLETYTAKGFTFERPSGAPLTALTVKKTKDTSKKDGAGHKARRHR